MTDFECYLSEGKFTKFDDHCKYISDKIDNNHPIKEIDRFVKSIPYKKENNLWRKRTAGDIINDNFVTGCTDACLVFITL